MSGVTRLKNDMFRVIDRPSSLSLCRYHRPTYVSDGVWRWLIVAAEFVVSVLLLNQYSVPNS